MECIFDGEKGKKCICLHLALRFSSLVHRPLLEKKYYALATDEELINENFVLVYIFQYIKAWEKKLI